MLRAYAFCTARWAFGSAVEIESTHKICKKETAMDFSLTDEQELLLESVREFCERYFTEDVVNHDFLESVYDYPVSWEIRELILTALHDLTSTVMSTRAPDTGV